MKNFLKSLKQYHNQFQKIHTVLHRTISSTSNIYWFSVLQTAKYRRRDLHKEQGDRRDRRSTFRV